MNKLKFIVNGAEVKRFHTIRTISEDTMGHHSFLVAMLVHLLAPNCGTHLLLAALTHDLAEHIVGDIPSPIKSLAGGRLAAMEEENLLQQGLHFVLNEDEKRTLTLADRLAGWVFCERELEMGNLLVRDCHRNYKALVQDLAPFSDIEQDVIGEVERL